MKDCPFELCDGSGYYEEMVQDDIIRTKCLCLVDKEIDEDDYLQEKIV